MGFAVLLALVMGILWIAIMILQFIALLSLITIGLAIWAVIAMYGLSFLGLYFILSEANIGWAIFGARLLGTALLKTSVRHLKRLSR
ncbi:MAG: hypothetical protein AB9M53_07835 [Leptothrix sp. (in: b-proteobacteria)]